MCYSNACTLEILPYWILSCKYLLWETARVLSKMVSPSGKCGFRISWKVQTAFFFESTTSIYVSSKPPMESVFFRYLTTTCAHEVMQPSWHECTHCKCRSFLPHRNYLWMELSWQHDYCPRRMFRDSAEAINHSVAMCHMNDFETMVQTWISLHMDYVILPNFHGYVTTLQQ